MPTRCTGVLRRPSFGLLIALFVGASFRSDPPAAESESESEIRYGRDIQPLLADRCFVCHGPDAGTRRADLRLDLREDAVRPREDGAAVVAGDPDRSRLILRASSHDPDEAMPPPEANLPKLDAAELALLRRWIADGAKYEPHWAFVPPKEPVSPDVADASWPRDPIDRFVLAKLERAGFAPSPPADRAAFARRVFLDLTGLPPTPEELNAFESDAGRDAEGRLVERLLDEEPYRSRYAERMASPWLDLARYADTIGLHTDAGRTAWPYRDRVLASFRDDRRYDAFLVEQLAGDLLPGATHGETAASGFNRLHVVSDEGGAVPEEYLAEYAAERAATTATVFLGLTLACARCHDHKYDPLTQEDFYGFAAFFNSVDEPGVYTQEPNPLRAYEPAVSIPDGASVERIGALKIRRSEAAEKRDRAVPEDEDRRAAWENDLLKTSGFAVAPADLVGVESAGGATTMRMDDGSVRFTGTNSDDEVQSFSFRAAAGGLRAVIVEAFDDPRHASGSVGRASNGNAVLTGVELESDGRRVPLIWAYADVEQRNEDLAVVYALDSEDARGWGIDGHRIRGGRVAMFVAREAFGADEGADVRVRLIYRSPYAKHAFGRVRVRFAALNEGALERLPLASGGWRFVGPFPPDGETLFARRYGPEEGASIDLARNFGFSNRTWTYREDFVDGRPNALFPGTNVAYVGRSIFVPSARTARAIAASDDGLRVFVDGAEVFSHDVARMLTDPPDDVPLTLSTGARSLVLKIVNTGGEAGFSWRMRPAEGELSGDLVAALLPADARPPRLVARYKSAWRSAFSADAAAAAAELDRIEAELAAAEAASPRAMTMSERPESRPSFVLMRGRYDRPDLGRGVSRAVPAALSGGAPNAFSDRLELAAWMTDARNPLVARVAVNRVWETLFGVGLVRTSEDFGLRGERPSHPELLDHLAVTFVREGWSVKRLIKRIVGTATYRQSSRFRPELDAIDPDGRTFGRYPRRRLPAEALRDQALFVSGLLVERFGGPPVKPPQPNGLWEEVAMPASNTRSYAPDSGEARFRRSLYTYWKRASPPPAMLAFDAPTRESCSVRRVATTTPLQSLVLWNDESFVDAARALAARTLATEGDDASRLAALFRRAASRAPDAVEAEVLRDALEAHRIRYAASPKDAAKLAGLGNAGADDGAPVVELAAWTLVASAVLNADAVLSR